ncbi:DDE-type integrase/transposase/recombinase [Tepidiphilus sp. B18-69]|uniref:DDE-type integrase/transposase/recombinase n=1 Tax=Tepidiphilus baoligensis TaxID=2698687 RepID=A0ABX1QPM2_9PROT|nr:DDE-type integrase/transposase/recombinase [Tepidiphilus baoligensis]
MVERLHGTPLFRKALRPTPGRPLTRTSAATFSWRSTEPRVGSSTPSTRRRRPPTPGAFLRSLLEAAPFRLRTIPADNGKEFTDRFITRGERTPTGTHAFDEPCQALGIEHRLTKPRRPQTNGMVEWLNDRISEVLATHRFDSRASLEATIQRYVWLLYNHHIPQKALGHITPVEAMKRWYKEKPELFIKIPRNRPGPDI